MALGIVLVVLALLAAYVVILFNKLVKLRNTVRSSWSDIDVMLKKRYNLVDNLVEIVKGYAAHERGVLETVTEARTRAMQSEGPGEKSRTENLFKDTLKSLFAVAEAYPDLKANTNFLELQRQMVDIENDIEYARRYYNAVVRDYNTLTESFPSNLVASQFGFEEADFFELASPEEAEPVKVEL